MTLPCELRSGDFLEPGKSVALGFPWEFSLGCSKNSEIFLVGKTKLIHVGTIYSQQFSNLQFSLTPTGLHEKQESMILAVPSLYPVSRLQTCFRVCTPQGQGYAVASSSVCAL